jgi:hypothetical protein
MRIGTSIKKKILDNTGVRSSRSSPTIWRFPSSLSGKRHIRYSKKNTPPPALLPEGIEVDVSENDGFENPDDSDDEFNDKNWGQDFCKRFGEVLNVKDSRTNSISYNKF